VEKGLAMVMSNDANPRTLRRMLAEWWRSWRRKSMALAQTETADATPGERQILAAKRPDDAALLPRRLVALHLDQGKSFNEGGTIEEHCNRLRSCAPLPTLRLQREPAAH